MSVFALSSMCDGTKLKQGSSVVIDIQTADFGLQSNSDSIAEMILVLQMATSGQFYNRADNGLINFPFILIR